MTHTPGPWFAGWLYQGLRADGPKGVTGPRSVLPADRDSEQVETIPIIAAGYTLKDGIRRDDSGEIVCSVHVYGGRETPIIDDRMKADARLIAAAPAMKEFADKLLIYAAEGESDQLWLSFDGLQVRVPANSPIAATLLRIEAHRKAIVAQAEGKDNGNP